MVFFVSGQCELFYKTLPLYKSIKKTIIGLKHLSMSQLSNLIESKSFCGNTLKSYSTCYAMLHETLRKWKMLFLFFWMVTIPWKSEILHETQFAKHIIRILISVLFLAMTLRDILKKWRHEMFIYSTGLSFHFLLNQYYRFQTRIYFMTT